MKKPIRFVVSFLLIVAICIPLESKASTFDFTTHIDSSNTSNLLGLAVNSDNGNIILTSLSYDGSDNLWEFTSDGTFVRSTRAAFDTGVTGNLGSATVGKDGHLFIDASRGVVSSGSLTYERNIVEMSQDGGTIFSSFSTDSFFGGVCGTTYNPTTELLLVATGRVGTELILREITTSGTQVSFHTLDVGNWFYDLAYDTASGNIFALKSGGLLDEYSYTSGTYSILNTYDLLSVGVSGWAGAMDINRANGLFYVQEGNERVVEFAIDDLSLYDPNSVDPGQGTGSQPIPEPATMILFGIGLLGFAGVSRKKTA